jgi:ABC-type multidrug transport system fused ATPase/permease subunit
MALENKVIKHGEGYFKQLAESKLRLAKYNQIIATFLEPLTLAVVIPIFLLSYRNPAFNIASFAAILYLIQKMFSFIHSMQIRVSLINESIPHLTSILAYQEEARKHKEQAVSGEDFKFDSNIEFEDVRFSYPDIPESILSGLSFNLKKGETIGLIGPSGAGKTTIVDLFLRLLNPSGGRIKIDGKDISEINLHKWRSSVGYVSQDIFLLNDTIANNIRFYNDSVSQEDVIEASKLANIHDFIVGQNQGFDALVGERGLRLSAGQRQRIVLARVLATRPKVLVLDEATSSLDNESELAIQQAIEGLKGRMTIIIIAHRLSTVMNANRLLVLNEGVIAEEGPPRELLENKDSYFHKTYNVRN